MLRGDRYAQRSKCWHFASNVDIQDFPANVEQKGRGAITRSYRVTSSHHFYPYRNCYRAPCRRYRKKQRPCQEANERPRDPDNSLAAAARSRFDRQTVASHCRTQRPRRPGGTRSDLSGTCTRCAQHEERPRALSLFSRHLPHAAWIWIDGKSEVRFCSPCRSRSDDRPLAGA
jgi:hypothetical protein